jgi:ubiquinone biosynthesis protein
LSIPLFAFFTVLTVLVLAAGLRRLMGIALSPLRTVIAALIAFFVASPIITTMAGAAVTRKHPGILPGLWFVFLGVVIAMLVGMIFLVISEALVPSGSLPVRCTCWARGGWPAGRAGTCRSAGYSPVMA